jgi:hypothetical protein
MEHYYCLRPAYLRGLYDAWHRANLAVRGEVSFVWCSHEIRQTFRIQLPTLDVGSNNPELPDWPDATRRRDLVEGVRKGLCVA